MMKNVVLSLYDYTTEAVQPWAAAGYECRCYDIQHPKIPEVTHVGALGGTIIKCYADLTCKNTVTNLLREWREASPPVVFMSAFPVCTDLAVSGARHFASKEQANPGFQDRAASYAALCGEIGDDLGVPYYVENPVSRLATLWRAPDHRFDPCDFGGYIPEAEAAHPRWPEAIPPRDAYTKKTCLWVGGGFQMPSPLPVEPIRLSYTKRDGTVTKGSPQFGKLGGSSQRTKDIRSATPRGFARAVFEIHSRR